MTELDREINTIIMNEVGLEIGDDNIVRDQDNGSPIQCNERYITPPGVDGGYGTVEFDPHNNRKLMNSIFGYFLDKYSEETGIEASAFYNKRKDNGECIECKMSDNTVITSQPYKKDSLKYTDIIIQLNGGQCGDELKKYDITENATIKSKK